MMADISIDPKYEYDAPVYVDFATVALDQLENDGADEWFGKSEQIYVERGLIRRPFLLSPQITVLKMTWTSTTLSSH